eukprot:6814390-Prymnesium_polylepis.1
MRSHWCVLSPRARKRAHPWWASSSCGLRRRRGAPPGRAASRTLLLALLASLSRARVVSSRSRVQ